MNEDRKFPYKILLWSTDASFKDEDNKYNAIYKDHNEKHVYSKSICNVSAHKQKFVNKHSKIMHKLNNRKEREQITAIKKGAFSKYEKLW